MNSSPSSPWYEVGNIGEIPSPALLVYPDRVKENLRKMIAVAGGPDRLRPHIKTHKMGELVRLQTGMGVRKCKCATVAEAELAARNGAEDVLLALQPVGPNIRRLLELKRCFPGVTFSAIVDDEKNLQEIARLSQASGISTPLFLDLNVGMDRTGIAPGGEALRLYGLLCNTPFVSPAGLHAYDGQIREPDPAKRKALCDEAFEPVAQMADRLRRAGLPVPVIVAGGSPTFPFHARRAEVETSPGTTVFWDDSYRRLYPDLGFFPAALVLTRVISKPSVRLLCFDLGHKAVASEMPQPRLTLLGLEDAALQSQSEEHLVVSTDATGWEVGDHAYGIPTHICPTVARYERAYTVRDGRAAGQWAIEARDRVLTI